MSRLVRGVNEADPGNNSLFAEWQEKYHSAIEQTRARSSKPGVLIEVAAQHPLSNGVHPNDEFSARLDVAVRLFHELEEQEKGLVRIYVPGSVHMDNGVSDLVSLSEAGCLYLESAGIPKRYLIGDDANVKYKGDVGVYNSSDECFVATRIFEELEYGRLCCVCSPAQLLRKALSYIEFGYVPDMYSVPVEEMFHSYVDEAFLYIPRLLEDGSGLQSDSQEAERLRRLRKPQ